MTEPKNVAETIFAEVGKLAPPQRLDLGQISLDKPLIVTLPEGVREVDLTARAIAAAEIEKPLARRGTAMLGSLQSLIDWTNRHKGENSVVFAEASETSRAMTAVIDYHLEGPPSLAGDGDPRARHGKHRGAYKFPMSTEWLAWNAICSGKPLSGPELAEFLEDRAEDILNPSPVIMGTAPACDAEAWEVQMIELSAKLGGRFGTFASLKTLADEFKMQESTGIVAKTNRDTGETTVQFVNEHKQPDGSPISVPTLFMVAIPVFDRGPAYRIAVRIRYRRAGAGVAWILSLYNPQAAIDDAWTEALDEMREKTGLPLFEGRPEA